MAVRLEQWLLPSECRETAFQSVRGPKGDPNANFVQAFISSVITSLIKDVILRLSLLAFGVEVKNLPINTILIHIWRHQKPQINISPQAPQNLSVALFTHASCSLLYLYQGSVFKSSVNLKTR